MLAKILAAFASIMIALEHRHGFAARWAMLLFSGIVDIILAGIIFAGLPGTAAWAIGLLVGINLVFGGTALVSMARACTSCSRPRVSP